MSEFLRSNVNNIKIIVAIIIAWILFNGKNRFAKFIKVLIMVLGIFCILDYFKQGYDFVISHLL